MPFPEFERKLLHAVKGVGPKVVERLEQIGFSSLAELAEADADHITKAIAEELGSSCWRNSPLAKTAIQRAIHVAQKQHNLSVIDTERYLTSRASKGDEAKFRRVLSKVRACEPEAGDEIEKGKKG